MAGKGNTHIQGIGKIEGFLFIPEIPYNILATIKLCKNTNIEVTFKNGGVHMTKNGENIGEVIIKNGLSYFKPVKINQLSIEINLSTKGGLTSPGDKKGGSEEVEGVKHNNGTPNGDMVSIGKPIHDNCAHLLHRKLGHISFPIIKKMTEYSEGLKLKNCENYLKCSVCKCSKLKTKSRPKKSVRTTDSIFQLVHMDLRATKTIYQV